MMLYLIKLLFLISFEVLSLKTIKKIALYSTFPYKIDFFIFKSIAKHQYYYDNNYKIIINKINL